jgi:hypothetical protein
MSLLSRYALLSAVFCLAAAAIAVISLSQNILSQWKSGNQRIISESKNQPHYKAPLSSCPESEQDPKQDYIVMLRQGYSMAQHDAAIGTLMEPYIHRIVEQYTEQIVYGARPIDAKLLKKIRGDPGVENVGCNTYWWDVFE